MRHNEVEEVVDGTRYDVTISDRLGQQMFLQKSYASS
jgi:hypothetical protein